MVSCYLINPDWFDVILEVISAVSFFIALIATGKARKNFKLFEGKGWKFLRAATIFGLIGTILGVVGEFFWVSPQFVYDIYRYVFISLIASSMGLFLIGFYRFYKFHEFLFAE